VLIISLGSFQHWKICFKLSKYWLWRDKGKIEIFCEHVAYLHSILWCPARPGYLIRPIRTVCNYRKCSFLTGLITSLTDLLQANHQGRIGTTKTKSTGSPIASLSEFFCFALAKIFFRPRREPVCRLEFNPLTTRFKFQTRATSKMAEGGSAFKTLLFNSGLKPVYTEILLKNSKKNLWLSRCTFEYIVRVVAYFFAHENIVESMTEWDWRNLDTTGCEIPCDRKWIFISVISTLITDLKPCLIIG